ncbi:MAG: hypothetical protein ACLQUY_17300 [Ktedonobacterales bacterium]
MAESGKTTSRAKKPKTIPVLVLTEPMLAQQPREATELLPSHFQLVPTQVSIEVDDLEAKINAFLDSMLPVTDSMFARQSGATEVDTIALALAVTADGQVGLAGVVSGSLQVQASITVTLAKKKAGTL